jgi:hypothetical protein
MNRKIISAIACLCLLLTSCGSSSPSDSDAREVFDKGWAPMAMMGFKLVDFKKLNGEMREFQGGKSYIFTFLATAEAPEGVFWAAPTMGDSGRFVRDPRTAPSFGILGPTQRVAKGAIAVRRGIITFNLTERGWVSELGVPDHTQDGYCKNGSAADCAKTMGMDRLSFF